MPQLLRRPFGNHGKVHEITPTSAGWRYVGFSLYRLRAGETVAEATGDREVILVMVEGKARLSGRRPATGVSLATGWTSSRRRRRTASTCPTAPSGRPRPRPTARSLSAPRPGKGGHEARRIGPDGITLTERGKGTNTRHINNIAMENEDWCDSLLVTEVFTPAGHWSSYPSHRHDEDDFPRITYLEETYYHRLNPRDGFGIQRVYTDDGRLDETMAVARWRRRAGSARPPPLRRALRLRDVLSERHGGSSQEVALRSRSRGRMDHEARRLSVANERIPLWISRSTRRRRRGSISRPSSTSPLISAASASSRATTSAARSSTASPPDERLRWRASAACASSD